MTETNLLIPKKFLFFKGKSLIEQELNSFIQILSEQSLKVELSDVMHCTHLLSKE